jgi:type I restriction enzyme M protein
VKGVTYEDVPGFCRSVALAEIKAADYSLTPSRYVGAVAVVDDGEPIDQKVARLSTDLLAAFDESARLERLVRKTLERLG